MLNETRHLTIMTAAFSQQNSGASCEITAGK